MGALTFTEEFASPVPAKRMFTALILEADTLIPKLMPQAIKSIEKTHGDGGPGTIKTLTLVEAKVRDERTTSKKARLPPKRGQIKVRVVSGAFKKAMGLTKTKGELTGEGRKGRLPPKRGQVKVRMMSIISASVSRLISKVGNLLKRKKKVA